MAITSTKTCRYIDTDCGRSVNERFFNGLNRLGKEKKMKKIWKWLMCLFLVLMVSITGATKVQASTYARVVYRNLLPSLGGTDILYVSGKGKKKND